MKGSLNHCCSTRPLYVLSTLILSRLSQYRNSAQCCKMRCDCVPAVFMFTHTAQHAHQNLHTPSMQRTCCYLSPSNCKLLCSRSFVLSSIWGVKRPNTYEIQQSATGWSLQHSLKYPPAAAAHKLIWLASRQADNAASDGINVDVIEAGARGQAGHHHHVAHQGNEEARAHARAQVPDRQHKA